MPYFLRHYQQFAKVFVIDDFSTDHTVKIARQAGATVLQYPYLRRLNEEDHSNCFVDMYKHYSKDADWVMCVDTDEFIHFQGDIGGYLGGKQGIVKPKGYMMISENPPTTTGQIYDEIKTGVRMRQYDKPVIVQPHIELEFGDGRHSVKSDVKPITSDLKLLHYKYLGRNYYEQRSLQVYPRTDMGSDEIRAYRLTRGLRWYDRHINTKEIVI